MDDDDEVNFHGTCLHVEWSDQAGIFLGRYLHGYCGWWCIMDYLLVFSALAFFSTLLATDLVGIGGGGWSFMVPLSLSSLYISLSPTLYSTGLSLATHMGG
ncbi:hypothetical protein BKA64DRAFT_186011 [Cadophora sp. MPI-SDFR-AT-0126]|nr:hypothetical protein BKA64DRAFT_186011 [Leotiomycetes sp. MPI-SDFR-AT-0126]